MKYNRIYNLKYILIKYCAKSQLLIDYFLKGKFLFFNTKRKEVPK